MLNGESGTTFSFFLQILIFLMFLDLPLSFFIFFGSSEHFFLPLKILLHFPCHAFLQPGNWGGRTCPVCPHSVSTCLSACLPASHPFSLLRCTAPAPSRWINLSQASFLISCLIAESPEWVYQHKSTFHAMFLIILLNTVFICVLRLELYVYVNGSLSSLW